MFQEIRRNPAGTIHQLLGCCVLIVGTSFIVSFAESKENVAFFLLLLVVAFVADRFSRTQRQRWVCQDCTHFMDRIS